jgi:hypothetical protein
MVLIRKQRYEIPYHEFCQLYCAVLVIFVKTKKMAGHYKKNVFPLFMDDREPVQQITTSGLDKQWNGVTSRVLIDPPTEILNTGNLVEDQSILSSSTIANGTADSTGDTSGTVTVTRDSVDVTSSVTVPSFDGINTTSSGTSLDAILVNVEGAGLQAGDVITFSCATQTDTDVTITLVSGDLKTGKNPVKIEMVQPSTPGIMVEIGKDEGDFSCIVNMDPYGPFANDADFREVELQYGGAGETDAAVFTCFWNGENWVPIGLTATT